MRVRRTAAAVVAVAAAVPALAACSVEHEQDRTGPTAAGAEDGLGESEGEETGEEEPGEDAAPDLDTCLDELTPAAAPYPEGFPADWPWPGGTVVFDAEDRGEYGVVVSAATDVPFADVLDFLNGEVQDAGYVVTSGETEESDAEASWEGNGYRGRWAIRASATCPGETTIQVLSTDD